MDIIWKFIFIYMDIFMDIYMGPLLTTYEGPRVRHGSQLG